MKFWGIFRFELSCQLRRAWTWLFFTILIVFAFLFTRDGSLSEVQYADFFLNSPFMIAGAAVFGGTIWLLAAAAVAGEAAARDVATGMHPLTYTTPVSKAAYLGGRFLAAFVLNALILLAVPVGNLLAVSLPGVHPDAVGPFRPAAYLTAYAFIALPNAFVATAIQFSLAARSGRPMAAYLGSLLLFFMGFFVASFLLFKRGLGTLLDPIGIRFLVEDVSHLWTTFEKSWRLLSLDGIVLRNRLLWLGIALGSLAITYLRFHFAHRTVSTWWTRRRNIVLSRSFAGQSPVPAPIGITAVTSIPTTQTERKFGLTFHVRKTIAIALDSFRTISGSWAGLALLAVIPLLTVLVVLDQMASGGVPLTPATALVIRELTAPMSAELSRWVIVPLFTVFFAGELVWRERDAGLSEITDSMPGSEWHAFFGKFLGLTLMLVLFLTFLGAAGMLAQTIMGYYNFEIGLYMKILFCFQLPEYLLFALLAFVIHVLVDQKYLGHLAAITAYVFIALASLFGIEHDLLIYGAGPGWSYSQMRGFGPSVGPWLWFKLYWTAWAFLLAVLARLLWVRGREKGFRVRLRLAHRRFTRSTSWISAAALGLILTLGGFIFYNTSVLNEYLTPSVIAERSAKYERRCGQYAGIPQPRLTAANLHVEIYPEQQEVGIRGTYCLVNRSTAAIDSVHVATASDVETGEIEFDRPANRILADEDLGCRIYVLEKPLQPGDSLKLDFRVLVKQHGFRENGVDASLAENGTCFTNLWLPAIGYQRNRELSGAAERRDHGLTPRPMIPSLYDAEARKDRDGGIVFEAVIGTRQDQIAVAPGVLRRTWTEGGRRYFHYSTDGPIGGEWAFFSAGYAVHEAQWKDPDGSGQAVKIRIFHHPQHTTHLNRMVQGVRASLDYYTRQFGPYRHNHISIVERPGNGTGMHAETSMLTYTEGFSLWNPENKPGSLDLPFAVVTHEMAHQWTVPYAFVEGAPVMSESLAWYYGMKAVENTRGYVQLRRLLDFMRQPHPFAPIRRGEPLLRGLDPYMSYRKGPFALYALSVYMGEERVNEALRHLLKNHKSDKAPLATTLDLYRELQAVTPDSLMYLLHDLFEVNTFWELGTDQVTVAETKAGTWQVKLQVRARKIVADSTGVEKEAPMNELVQIGIFGPGDEDDKLGAPLYVQMHRVRSGKQTITVNVPRKPALAGLDPYHLLDWEMEDNVQEVKFEK